MLIRSIKNNILADIFEDYFNVCAVDLDRSSIVRNIQILFVSLKQKKSMFRNMEERSKFTAHTSK